MSRPALLLAAAIATIGVASARTAAPPSEIPAVVTARGDVAITHGRVRLSDLFNGLPPARDREIGPGPAPGRSIDVPEPQLAAIAAQFGVDWQPEPDLAGMTIRRSGRPATQAEIMAVLVPALEQATGRTGERITLQPFQSPVLPAEFDAPPQVLQLDAGRGDGRFSATLGFAPPDAEPVTLRVSGRTEEMVDGLVLTRALPAGSVLTPDELVADRRTRKGSAEPPLTDPAEAIGFPLARAAAAGTVLTAAMLSHPPAVIKNHPVVLRLEQGGLTLTASGLTLEAGSLGAFIHVLNTTSRAVLLGQVIDGTDVRIEPGSNPVGAGNGASSPVLGGSGRIS